MAADPIVYCLEQLTDYDQFERLCHDLMALDGYRGIEPLGGSKDKGRDAIHVAASTNGAVTVFAYSVREDCVLTQPVVQLKQGFGAHIVLPSSSLAS
jgi:hypothetical protein